MVATNQHDPRFHCALERQKLLGGPNAGLHVLPLPVEEVARDHHEIDLFFDRQRDQVLEGLAGRRSAAVGPGLPRTAANRAAGCPMCKSAVWMNFMPRPPRFVGRRA